MFHQIKQLARASSMLRRNFAIDKHGPKTEERDLPSSDWITNEKDFPPGSSEVDRMHKGLGRMKELRIERDLEAYKDSSSIFQLKPQKLPPMARIRDLLHVYGLRAKKHLSQNFLLRRRYLEGLVRAAGIMPGHRVVEIGAGPGNLSRAILGKSPFELMVVEKDRRFLPLLEQLADSVLPGQMKIILGDALEHDFRNIFGDPKHIMSDYQLQYNLPDNVINFKREWSDPDYPPIRLIGNLPFSVAIPLLLKYLNHINCQDSFWECGRIPMLLTFQEEVARRICAQPGSYERTRLSVMCQNYCHVDYKFTIPGSAFVPPAMVDTGVVRFHPRLEPICKVPFKLFEKFIRITFHHRNKTLYYNYRKLFPEGMKDAIDSSIGQSGVNPAIFPYMISNIEAASLCEVYYNWCQKVPALAAFDYRVNKKLLSAKSLEVLKQAGINLLE